MVLDIKQPFSNRRGFERGYFAFFIEYTLKNEHDLPADRVLGIAKRTYAQI